MMREEVLEAILREKVIAIIRLERGSDVPPVVEALRTGGLRCMEIALTTPGAIAAIEHVRAQFPDVLLGAGTVTRRADLDACTAAGARFIVTPVMVPDLISPAHEAELPVVMGAFSPTEVFAADAAGADLIKLFPASSLGPDYLSALRGPLPHIRVAPTGGVGTENARAWLRAGAVALGVGGSLTRPDAVRAGRFDELSAYARRLLESIA